MPAPAKCSQCKVLQTLLKWKSVCKCATWRHYYSGFLAASSKHWLPHEVSSVLARRASVQKKLKVMKLDLHFHRDSSWHGEMESWVGWSPPSSLGKCLWCQATKQNFLSWKATIISSSGSKITKRAYHSPGSHHSLGAQSAPIRWSTHQLCLGPAQVLKELNTWLSSY